MQIFKEESFDNSYIGKAVLENGVKIYVSMNGYADGSDGKRYVGVFRVNENDDWISIGWTADASENVVI